MAGTCSDAHVVPSTADKCGFTPVPVTDARKPCCCPVTARWAAKGIWQASVRQGESSLHAIQMLGGANAWPTPGTKSVIPFGGSMPSRLLQPPYTGVAVVQYFAYRRVNGNTRPATDADVRDVFHQAMDLYQRAHPWRVVGASGLLVQSPADRGFECPYVLRVIPDAQGGRP